MNSKALVALISFAFLAALSGSVMAASGYIVVDTNQQFCYDEIADMNCPVVGQPFYGQDSQYDGSQMYYQDNGDGTVTDLQTGLMWQQTPDPNKFTFADAVAGGATFNFAGHTDWRLPTIKELYSLMDFSGSSFVDAASSVPYINTDYFDFEYGDTSAGERFIDAQYWSSTEYVGTTMNGNATAFGVNFADGRIKGYPSEFVPNPSGGFTKTAFVRYVRGNTDYGVNKFVDNGDGTITDLATGLMWQQGDSTPMNWQGALAYAEGLSLAGHDDWRLPNAKELQSIVDYTRAPDAVSPAPQGPAIDPVFTVTETESFYWAGTTHLDGPNARWAVYVCFGQAFGWMEQPPGSSNYTLLNVHGAGAQRSDPKSGDPGDWPNGHGPQGDVVRINNYVRCVRGQSTQYCQGMVTGGDRDIDCDVDDADVRLFAGDWLDTDCGLCSGADLTGDEEVGIEDLAVVSENYQRQGDFTNLVMLVADDMGWADVGYRPSIIQTPNIDSLTTDGVTLNYYYSFPICGPSRVALMTGRSPTRLGRTGNILGGDGLDLDEHLMPESFKAAGFQTWCLGKWHLGDADERYYPHNRGFDHFYGHLGGSIKPYTHTIGPADRLDWQRNGIDVIEPGYSPDLLAAEAVSLLRNRDRSRPVMLYLPFHLVHTPLEAPQTLIDKYTALGIIDIDRATYAAMAESLDIAMGVVLQEIDDQGMRDSTLVVFISDNGGNERDGGASNDPLRGAKNSVWEGGIRVPGAMRWPGVLTPGTTSNQTISIMDMFPTLTAALGVVPQNVRPFDGNNRWTQIRDGLEVQPEALVIQRQDIAIFDGQWKMVALDTGINRLFDIRNSPNELIPKQDVADDYPAVVTDLEAKIQAMLDTAP